jgi:hypothetical protein
MIDVHARDVKKKIEAHDIHELAAPDGKDRPDVFVCFFKEEGKKTGRVRFSHRRISSQILSYIHRQNNDR